LSPATHASYRTLRREKSLLLRANRDPRGKLVVSIVKGQKTMKNILLLPLLLSWCVLALNLCAAPTQAIMIPQNLVQSSYVLSKMKSRKKAMGTSAALSGSSRLPPLAMAIPGYGIAEQVFVGGFSNFLSIYNAIITVRILLSWFPQAQGVAALQPIYAVTDPYLNLFRGIIPPIGGFDLSPLAAFFVLNVAGQVTAAVGCELPTEQAVRGGRLSGASQQLRQKPRYRLPFRSISLMKS